jgi:hypothetical protein
MSYHPLRGEQGSSEIDFTDGTSLRCPSDSYVELGKFMGVIPYETCTKKPAIIPAPSLYSKMQWKIVELLELVGLKEKEEKTVSRCAAPHVPRKDMICPM